MHAFFGALSDRLGRRTVYLFGALVVVLAGVPFFLFLGSGNGWLTLLGFVLLINVGHNAINAVEPAFFSELFSADTRYSGTSIGAQLGAIVAGGFTPFIAKALSAADHDRWTLVAGYLVVMAIVSALAAWFAPETVATKLEVEDDSKSY